MSDIDLMLEAERRGILPPDRMEALREARRRGLVPQAAAARSDLPGSAREAPGPEIPPPFDPRNVDDLYTGPSDAGRQANQRASMWAENIVPGSAPAGVRARASFGVDDVQAYQAQLGPDFEVAKSKDGRVIFRKKGAQEWTTAVNPETFIDMGDIASMAGGAVQQVGAIGGGIIGGVAGAGMGPAGATMGTIGGTSLGSAGGETARILAGIQMGSIPKPQTDEDVMKLVGHAMSTAALDTAGAAGGAIAYRIYRAIASRGLGTLKEMDPKTFAENLTKLREKTAAAGLPEEGITPATVMKDTPFGDELGSMERRLAGQGGAEGRAMREKIVQRDEAAQGAVGRELGPEPTIGRTELGERAGRAVSEDVGGPVRAAEAAATKADTAAEMTAGEALAGSKHPITLGSPFRARMEAAKEASDKMAAEVYGEIREQGSTLSPIVPRNLMEMARTRGEELRAVERWVPDLTEGETKLLDPIVKVLNKEPGASLDFGQIQKILSLIGQRKRELADGSAKGSWKVLNDMEDALLADRATMVPKELQAKITSANEMYRSQRELFDRTFMAKVLGQKSGGGDVLPEEGLVGAIISKPENIDAVVELTKMFPNETAGVKEMLKQAILYRATQRAGVRARAVGGEADVQSKSLLNWIDENQESLGKLFSPEEVKKMTNVGLLRQEADRAALRLKEVVKSYEGRRAQIGADDINPEKFFEKTWNEARPDKAKALRAAFETHDPELATAYRGFVRQKFLKETLQKDGQFDIPKVQEILNDADKMEMLRTWYGGGFAGRMKQLQEAIAALQPSERFNVATGQPASGFHQKVRGTVAIFLGPLTRTGTRISTAAKGMEEEINQRVARALTNPDEFQRLLRKARGSRFGVATGAITGEALAEALREGLE